LGLKIALLLNIRMIFLKNQRDTAIAISPVLLRIKTIIKINAKYGPNLEGKKNPPKVVIVTIPILPTFHTHLFSIQKKATQK
jgi:hypothetical protein